MRSKFADRDRKGHDPEILELEEENRQAEEASENIHHRLCRVCKKWKQIPTKEAVQMLGS